MNRGLGVALVITSLFGLLGLKSYQASHNVLEVEVTKPDKGMLYDTVLASGSIAYKNEIEIRTEVTGLVTKVYFEEGEFVSQGDLLLQLDDTAYKAQENSASAALSAQKTEVEAAEERLRELNRRFENQSSLVNQGFVQLEMLEQLRSDTKIANINVNLARANLKRTSAELERVKDLLNKTRFVAPMSGLLTSVDIEVGETVIAGTTNIIGSSLITLSDTSMVLAEIRVSESDIADIHLGQSVNVFAASHPKTAIAGKITKIGSTAKVLGQTRGLSFKVDVALEPTSFELFSGTSCRAEVIISERLQTLNLPIAAIRQDQEQDFVWIMSENKAKKRAVTIGLSTDTHLAILSGLSADDEVLIGPGRALASLTEGTRIAMRLSE